MNLVYRFDYLPCQSCTAKIHCDNCASELRERLLKLSGVLAVEIDIPNKHITLQAESIDTDDLLDEMEDAGIFAD